MTRRRVAHTLEAIWSGGVEQTRLSLARGLDPDRYEQIVLCTQASGVLPAQLEAAGCRVHEIGRFRFPLDPRPIAAATRILRRYRPDIVHGAVFEGVEVAAIAGRLARARAVVGEETADPHSRRWTGHLLYRALLAGTDRMIGVSPMVSRYLVDAIRYPAQRTVTIENGVRDPGPADPMAVARIRAQCDAAAGEMLIGTVGRLFDHHKRVSDLLRAMPAILAARPGTRLLIVGDGVDAAALRALAGGLGIAHATTFAGYQGETRAYFEAMDIYAHPAHEEAFGLVIVEAMLAARPVVATRVGGVPDVMAEETGILVDRGQPGMLARRLLQLAGDPGARQRMGQAGRRRAQARFGEQGYVAAVDRLYGELVRTAGEGRQP